MKNHFIMPYWGNKRTEVEEIYKNINLDGIKRICEPFCGSSAMSYYISTIHPGKFTYILNDNDKNLIKLYLTLQDEVKTNFFNCMLELLNNYMKKHKTREEQKYIYDNEFTGVQDYYIKRTYYNFRVGLFPNEDSNKYQKHGFKSLKGPIIDFLRNEKIIIRCEDANIIIKEYDDNKTIFLTDPPYLMVCNDFYCDKNLNVYEFILENKINNIYLILEYNWMIKYLFQGYGVHLYDKKYTGIKKKIVDHCIITNKKLEK
jgi:site-specific DNA-adenine methylase